VIFMLSKAKLILKYLFLNNWYANWLIRRLFIRSEDKIRSGLYLRGALLSASKKIPAYKNIPVPEYSDDYERFLKENYPVISKVDLIENRPLYYPNKGNLGPLAIVGKTSGTTGSPLDVARDYLSIIVENYVVRRHWRLAGGGKRATLRGDDVPSNGGGISYYNGIDKQLLLSSRDLKAPRFGEYVETLDKFMPDFLQTYPSTSFELAKYLDKRNENLSVPFVYTASEMLYPYQREMIEKRIGKVVDFYGMAERVAFAAECLEGNLHINTDYSYVEILDDDNNPTEDIGYIVGTTYHNHLMPLIRYRLSDRTKWKRGACSCGSKDPMIEAISGKYEDSVFDSLGNVISPSLITFAFKNVKNIERSQVAQVADAKWEIRVVVTPEFTMNDEDVLLNNMSSLVTAETKIVIRRVSDIKTAPSGKYRWVINECEK